ncbi:hypothetical protein C8R43DRAFT_1121049 [Mycena crocata]|nr:hypothetical protein C8R43DRAFT_1121049 [Mycena crocata]
MSRLESEPATLARTTSMRRLTNILRPTRRARAQSALSLPARPRANVDGSSPPSSPSLYSLSSDTGSRLKLVSKDSTDFRSLGSPTSSTFSASASEGHGDTVAPARYATPELELDNVPAELKRAVPPSSRTMSSSSRESQASPVEMTDHTWAANRGYRIRPQRIIIADMDDRFNDSETISLHTGERGKLQPLSPSEWIGSNVHAKRAAFLNVSQLSPVESESRSPSDASSSSASPATPRPRPRPVSESNRLYLKPGGDLDTPLCTSRSETIPEGADPELLTEHRRRHRSASEPRSFLGTPVDVRRHAGTEPSTPTEYIVTVPDVDSGPKSSSSQTISPPPRQSSLNSPMPDDVYFTAAGRRESRMYISPDTAHNHFPVSPMQRGHAYSSSDPVLPVDLQSYTSARFATWSGNKKREPTSSGRPFEDPPTRGTTPSSDGDSTPVSRREDLWSGEWNRDDIQDVIRELRSLK